MWSGHVASWDGLPLSVDVTTAAGTPCGLPLVSLNHAYAQDKNEWESPSLASTAWNARFDNVRLAFGGYAVLTFTTRGNSDSCGPASSPTRQAPTSRPCRRRRSRRRSPLTV